MRDRRPNFLRWLLINTVVLAVTIATGLRAWGFISVESRIAAAVVLAAFAGGSLYAGRLAWRIDSGEKGLLLKHDLLHIEKVADDLPWLGLIGTMFGILLLFLAGRNSDTHALARHVQDGIATVFVPSIVGAIGSRVIDLTRHMLEHELGPS